jgi:hypothetical protein
MGLMNSIKSTLFGGTQKVNTLTPEQKALLSQMGGLQQQYNTNTYSTLNGIASNPESSYEYDTDNGAAAFQSGIVNPALQQLNQQLANTQHSSMLHTSANRYAQDQLKQNTMNNINNLSYQNQLQQQQLKQQAQDSAYNRQLSSLAQLMGGNQTVLGTQANAIQKTGGLLDILSAAGSVGQGVGAIMKGV